MRPTNPVRSRRDICVCRIYIEYDAVPELARLPGGYGAVGHVAYASGIAGR
jgi:hypothetical protein